MTSMLLLAAEGIEGVSPDHIASKLAVPIAIVIFVGGVFALLWSNYGWRKGALIYGVAQFGFMAVIGVFWWFGAPGTPVATGLQNFPGQAGDEYQSKWFAFEPGSPRAEFFDSTNNLGDFQSLEEFAGTADDTDPALAALRGDLDSVSSLMIEQYLPVNGDGQLQVGANRRAELQENTPEPDEGFVFGSPVYTAQVVVEGEDDLQAFFTTDDGQRVAGARLETVANYVPNTDEDAGPLAPEGATSYTEVVETGEWFAFKEPGAIWLPSAVWTALSFLLAGGCLFLLDRIEMREKREDETVEEPQDVEVPIAQ